MARYVELFMDCGALTRRDMLKSVFGPVTTFVDEGKTVLVEVVIGEAPRRRFNFLAISHVFAHLSHFAPHTPL